VAATDQELIKRRFIAQHPEIGLYVLSFYKDGKWSEVMIDDRLMVVGGKKRGYNKGFYLFASCPNPLDDSAPSDELWVPLIEKAYAKLHGGYGALDGGTQSYGVRDLTGAAPYSLPKDAVEEGSLLQKLRVAQTKNIQVMVGLSCHAAGVAREGDLGNGILSGHEYTLIDFIDKTEQGLPVLVIVRNPWGDHEYTGPWSDSSSEWTRRTKDAYGYKPDDTHDGVFCMSFQDATSQFTQWDFSFLYPESFFRASVSSAWTEENAGGCGNDGERFLLKNPQFMITVPEPPPGMALTGQIVLTQEDHRMTQDGDSYLFMGFNIFKSHNGGKITQTWKPGTRTKVGSGTYTNKRAVTALINEDDLPPGDYVIIPTCFNAGDVGDFNITIWMSYPVTLQALD